MARPQTTPFAALRDVPPSCESCASYSRTGPKLPQSPCTRQAAPPVLLTGRLLAGLCGGGNSHTFQFTRRRRSIKQ